MGFTKFGIKILWRLQFLEYLRTLCLKFQKAWTKIEVVLSLPWGCPLNWDSQQGRLRTTSIVVRAFWNFKLKVLKYSRNCSFTIPIDTMKSKKSRNISHLSTAVAWRKKICKHFVFYKYFFLILGLLKSRISKKSMQGLGRKLEFKLFHYKTRV